MNYAEMLKTISVIDCYQFQVWTMTVGRLLVLPVPEWPVLKALIMD
jgi:hypothetical protein